MTNEDLTTLAFGKDSLKEDPAGVKRRKAFNIWSNSHYKEAAVDFYLASEQGGYTPEGAEQEPYFIGEEEVNHRRRYWEKLAQIALPRFPEKQRGERISVKEYKQRLYEINKNDFPIRDIAGLTKFEAWQLLMSIRHNIRKECRKYCPEVLSRIESENKQKKQEAEDLR